MDRIIQKINDLPKVIGDEFNLASPPSKTVINNSIELIKKLPSFYQKMLDPEEGITPTPYGTIVFDWFFRKNFLSLEVGNTKTGYFSETPDGSNPKSEGVLISEVDVSSIVLVLDKIFLRTNK